MKTQQFLEHHGIRTNPFAEEDAQTDPVFKDHCIASTHHPTWDKIYGDPAEPATSIVFGEKGSGKTAMRLQIVRHLAELQPRASACPRVRHRVRRLQSVSRPLSRSVRRRGTPRRPGAGRVEAVGSHGRDPVAGRHRPGRSDSGVEADRRSADQRIRPGRDRSRSTGTRPATCCCWPPATTNRRPKPSAAAGTGCGASCAITPGCRSGTWRWASSATLAVFGLMAYLRKWDWLETPWLYLAVAAAWLPWLCRFAQRFWLASGVVAQRARRQARHAARCAEC